METINRSAEAKSAKERVMLDSDTIYLGNLNTIDTDMSLPFVGNYGSTIAWESKETLFLSHTGKVTRPTFGVGNRIVPLVATITYEDEVVQKTFDVTVIQEENKTQIIEAYPVQLQVQVGQQVTLPSIVIVKTDAGNDTVSSVTWESIVPQEYKQAGIVTIHGSIEGSHIRANAIIQVVDQLEEFIVPVKQVEEFIGNVVLEQNSPFSGAMHRFLHYLHSVDDNQMLYNFRSAANIDTQGAAPMTGWDAPECNLKGHTTGHYLSSLALAYNATGEAQLLDKINYMVQELHKCQQAMSITMGYSEGFLSAYSEEQFDLLEQYTTYPTIWAPYYTLHKIMAGLLDCYQLAGSKEALTICDQLGNWVYRRLGKLSNEQLHKMWSLYIAGEFGGMNEVLAKLYQITGNAHYLATAKYFDNDKLFLPMKENIDTLGDMHANQHIPQIIGALKLFEVEGKKEYFELAENFWSITTQKHTYQIGGVGETEMFKDPDQIASYLSDKTAETCASYNMLKLTKELYKFNPRNHYMDYYENTLFNHILSTEHKNCSHGGSTYFMPLAPGSVKKYDTHENTCCHGTGLENHFKYHESIYFHNDEELYVNLYIPSSLNWLEKGLTLTQKSAASELEKVTFHINSNKPNEKTTIKFRIPNWISHTMTVKINGTVQADLICENGYIIFSKVWSNDEIEFVLPHTLKLTATPDDAQIKSLSYGPYVLAAVSENTEFITWSYSAEEFLSSIKPTDEPLTFKIDDITFIPLYQVQEERYHAYFKFIK